MKYQLTFAALGLLGGQAVDAFWRLPCQSRSGLGRIDPIVDPGVPAAHVHAIHGGDNFGFSTTGADLLSSNCTSCAVTQDKSSYWHPAVYFLDADTGKAEMLEEEGGMLAYYLLYPNPGEQIKAFPPGFQMISGDTKRRNFTCEVPEPPKSSWSGYEVTQPALAEKALGFNCLNYFDASKTEPSLYRHYMPTKDYLDANCLSGLRMELMFPSCWNGKDLDSSDHKSHVAFPDQVMTGNCPSDFPVRLPSLFFETIWRTDLYKGRNGQFVLSNGDTTGYGYHGDFIAAWEDDVLQNAVDQCTNPSGRVEDCALFNLQSLGEQQQCTFTDPAAIAHEDASSPFSGSSKIGLLGNNPIFGAVGALAAGSSSSDSAPAVPLASLLPTAGSIAPPAGKKIASATAPSSSAVTPAPSVEAPAAPAKPACFSTTTTVKGQELWEICIDQQVVTITADNPAPTAHKRHLHEHQRRHAGH